MTGPRVQSPFHAFSHSGGNRDGICLQGPASPLRGASELSRLHRGLTVLLETLWHLPTCAWVTPVWLSLAGRSGCSWLLHIPSPFRVPSPRMRLPRAAGVSTV